MVVDALADQPESLFFWSLAIQSKTSPVRPSLRFLRRLENLATLTNIGATRRSRTGDLLITNQKKVMTLTKKTQAFPMMLRRYELDHWACMGLLASSSRTKGGQLSTLTA